MNSFDLIIIGTGAGGGTLLHALKDSGKKILVLERGTFLPREKENWDTNAVFKDERYHAKETWRNTADQSEFHPGTGYWVGGNTKVYGAALFRLRERDFETIQHHDGVSPEWPLKYRDFEPWYTEAEKLYQVHGKMGIDPSEPWRSGEYPAPPVSHEPRIQEVHDALVQRGLKPFYLPIGVMLDEQNPLNSACIRCDTCDGFPCLIHAKSDADILCVRPSLNQADITLMTEAKVTRLLTSPSGGKISAVEVEGPDGTLHTYSAPIVVLAAGAINSAAILLRSANEQHPDGLANGSGQVGRNLMKHLNEAMLGISLKENPTKFQKTMAVNDFYEGEGEAFPYPMGHIQLLGKSNKDMLALDAPGFTPEMALDNMAAHSVDWWMTGEDLPDPENRVTIGPDGKTQLHYTENNTTGFKRLIERWTAIMSDIDDGHSLLPHHLYLKKRIPIAGVAHQCGTARFGTDPKTSVLDLDCRAHEVDNLYVVDGSFFPSSGAVNPSLTIMANALRVGEILIKRMG
jgi:choline dehydrogenase-like flavoprotein